MPLLLKLKRQARADLFRIVGYITRQNQDGLIAERVGARILERCLTATSAPGIGSPLSDRAGVRKLLEGPYQIYFVVGENAIIILRIWDGRRGREPRLSP